jgi:hypothetical protein
MWDVWGARPRLLLACERSLECQLLCKVTVR